jgi:NAD(P)-dependent dehydrogenase (short-subunit alcohol dehydrogenase family)
MYPDLKNKTVLVTGSGKKSGIGYAIARKFAENGSHVIIADLGDQTDKENPIKTGTSGEMKEIAQELSGECGIKALAISFDVTDNRSIQVAVAKIKDSYGDIQVLVNNAGAGFGVPSTVQDYDEKAWMKTIDVNLHGVFRVSRAILPLMNGAGRTIVNVASRAGKVPPLFNGAYAVAKSGVIMLTKVMAKELAGKGIRVNAICPGQIMTDLESWRFALEADFLGTTVKQQEEEMCKTIPLNRIGSPAEVAKLAVYLASDESSYITGQAMNVTGGQLMEL